MIYSYRNSKSYLEFFVLPEDFKKVSFVVSEVDGQIAPEKLKPRTITKDDELAVKKATLKELAKNIRLCIAALDAEMKKPSDNDRGKRVAQITNALEMELHRFEHFTLKIPLEKLK